MSYLTVKLAERRSKSIVHQPKKSCIVDHHGVSYVMFHGIPIKIYGQAQNEIIDQMHSESTWVKRLSAKWKRYLSSVKRS